MNYLKSAIRNLQSAIQFISYSLRAKNGHGTHSPFVFDLYNEVIEPNHGNIKGLKKSLASYPKNWESYIFLENIRTENKTTWLKMLEDPLWTVSIDLYACGIAFIRPEQRKEHFVMKF